MKSTPIEDNPFLEDSTMLSAEQCSTRYICIIIEDNKPLIPLIKTGLLPGGTWIVVEPCISKRDVSLFWLNRSSSFFSVIYTKYVM